MAASFRSLCRLPHCGSIGLLIVVMTALTAGCRQQVPTHVPAAEVGQYEQGMKLLQSGKTAGAQAAFNQSIQSNAGYAPPYIALAQIESNSGNTARAIELLETLRKAAPQTPHVACHLAELHAIGEHFVEEWVAAKSALAQEPDCRLALMQYALALASAGEFKEATVRLQTVHQRFPQDERAIITLAQMLAKSGRPEDAWKQMDSLPEQSVHQVQANYVRAWLLAEYGRKGHKDDQAALQMLDSVLAAIPDDPSANLEKARILLNSGDAPSALRCLHTARRAAAPSVAWVTTVAAVQIRLHNPAAPQMEQNARAFSKLIDNLYVARQKYIANPNNRNNLVGLARLEAAIGSTQDAQTLLTQVLKQNPNDTEALELLTPRETTAPNVQPKQAGPIEPGGPNIKTPGH
jgi:thioredoxin-like negative regulator of GroEL